MARIDKETAKGRILESIILGPVLKSQLVLALPNIDDEKLNQVLSSLDRAEAARKEFGETSELYRQMLSAIEDSAMRAAELEADKILAEFDKQLQDCKL